MNMYKARLCPNMIIGCMRNSIVEMSKLKRIVLNLNGHRTKITTKQHGQAAPLYNMWVKNPLIEHLEVSWKYPSYTDILIS